MATLKRALPRGGRKQLLRDDGDYLGSVGQRVRSLRVRLGMTRRTLASHSGVSERFLAEVENGTGNASLLVLRQLARALNAPVESLVLESAPPSAEFMRASEILRTLSPQELARAQEWLDGNFRPSAAGDRRRRIALLGLRGAGKSTVGSMLAERLRYPFLELDRLIEKVSGSSLSAIFDLYGMNGFRRMERRCLEDVLAQYPEFVLATGGSLVSEPATYQRLLRSCYTVWLKADPEDHMQRVIRQGDTRPMAERPEAMADLKRILREREQLYAKADLTVDTSECPPRESLARIATRLR